MSHKEAKKERVLAREFLNSTGGDLPLGAQPQSPMSIDKSAVVWRVMIEQTAAGEVHVKGFPADNFDHARNLFFGALSAVIQFYIQRAADGKGNLIQVPKLTGIPGIAN